jgi:hypothetical protein
MLASMRGSRTNQSPPPGHAPLARLTRKWERSIHEVAAARRSQQAFEEHIDGWNAREVLELQVRVDAAEDRLRDVELQLARTRHGRSHHGRSV